MQVDESQVSELYRRYGHALFKRCHQLVGREAEAQELLQETFCQFWKNRSRFREDSSPFTFLYRIATNLSIDRLRRRTTAGVQLSVEDRPLGDETDTTERQPMAVDQLAHLTAGLDDETLTIAVMSHVDGLTQDEIALAMDLSRRTVGKRLKAFLEHTQGRAEATHEKDNESVAPEASSS